MTADIRWLLQWPYFSHVLYYQRQLVFSSSPSCGLRAQVAPLGYAATHADKTANTAAFICEVSLPRHVNMSPCVLNFNS